MKLTIDERNASQVATWIKDRDGVLVWDSALIGNSSQSITPYLSCDGSLRTKKPGWNSKDHPSLHITNTDDVSVIKWKEYKRFHVATRIGSQGLSIKVTDGGSNKIRNEVAKAKEKNKEKEITYDFDYYDYKNVVIYIEDTKISLTDWMVQNAKTNHANSTK